MRILHHDIFVRAARNWDRFMGVLPDDSMVMPMYSDDFYAFLGNAKYKLHWHDSDKDLISGPDKVMIKLEWMAGPHWKALLKAALIKRESA